MEKSCSNCKFSTEAYMEVSIYDMPCIGCVNDKVDKKKWEYPLWEECDEKWMNKSLDTKRIIEDLKKDWVDWSPDK